MVRPTSLVFTGLALVALAVAPHAQDMPSAPAPKGASERPAWQAHGLKPQTPNSPFDELVSGLYFRSKETQEMQADDFNNPGFLSVEQGEELWSKVDGAAGKSCASCHNEASTAMKGVAAAYPKWNEKLGKPVNLEQRINICRSGALKAEPWAFGSSELTAMTTYIRNQSRGMPVALKVDGPMTPWFERGQSLYYQRNGQLDLACASCHEKNHGKYLRADFLSQGQSNGFPVYRLRDQRLVPLHERMEGCMQDVRATPFPPLSDEFLALETYVAWRGLGLPVETPAVRN
ncbi:sulfur oxidation c-type cytochrome SoxA [Methylobacterium goesingense]|uniref:SoxAX cytochrome complex subunit A n=1 Tax=Methylobacterium goesingense TaxID=243690 RepID=A0ABV2LCG7_9HYPH|nr:sulfur oxidation c-type cytochrome SoxA [Methylobacterium goesingense]GJD75098.1 L-cysteine S-thiosulfotransferase subunit SoxA [Methylobacterium goesingense]